MLLACWAALGAPVSDATLVYYNARMALREGRADEALKLWLTRNTLVDRTGKVSPYDIDFRSITWVALAELGLCQDGLKPDRDGVGLFPLALFNTIVRPPRRHAPLPRTFDALEVDRQHRPITVHSVLDHTELRTVTFRPSRCLRPRQILIEMGYPYANTGDRRIRIQMAIHLLEQARETVDPRRVRNTALIEARLFDLHLILAEAERRHTLKRTRERARRGESLGLGRPSIRDIRSSASLDPDSPAALFLRDCAAWPLESWMALSPDRRLFLYDHARLIEVDPEPLDRVALEVLDALIQRGDGEAVAHWIARHPSANDPERRVAIWGGARGRALLNLDPSSGFRERAVIALHRGIDHLARGALPEALRDFARATRWAPESRAATAVRSLSRRWLAYVAAHFTLDEGLLLTLKTLLPRRDYSRTLEDLMWRAAFRADGPSFDRGLHNQLGRGALERRLALLVPLAHGDRGRFERLLRRRLDEGPSEVLRFLDTFVTRLELEDASIRAHQAPTVRQIRELLRPLAASDGGPVPRKAEALLARTQALLQGLEQLTSPSLADRARALSADGSTYAGVVRLAPSDTPPWPFPYLPARAPEAFSPFRLVPTEWRERTERVLGWTLGE